MVLIIQVSQCHFMGSLYVSGPNESHVSWGFFSVVFSMAYLKYSSPSLETKAEIFRKEGKKSCYSTARC